jgi:glycyl-tRNA synthetase beta chain
MAKDFLVEIGTEELPPKALEQLSEAFKLKFIEFSSFYSIRYGSIKCFVTPRRLALLVQDLHESSDETSKNFYGPSLDSAKDQEGKWTRAAIGFSARFGCPPEELPVLKDAKGEEKLGYIQKSGGIPSTTILPKIILDSLEELPIPKRMRWGASSDEFVRPVHWSVMLYGDEIIPATILGTQTTNQTRGHRFHCDTTLEIANPGAYEKLLEESGHVIVDFAKRKQLIRDQVISEAKKIGGTAVIADDLLDEVTAIIEWPTALTGSFDKEFLQVPPEALISTMQDNQKYFPVTDKDGKLSNQFVFVANIVSNDPAKVIEGNERVIRPRFSDAKFFFETDKQQRLEARLEKLNNIVFQQKLGSVYDKSLRVSKLAAYIAKQIGSDPTLAERAGLLSKADLVSNMVLEFDTMQGIAGFYYAQNDGEHSEVAVALKDQYLPKFAGDVLPDSLTACAVGLADRLDTLVGIFGIGQPPTGSKDPFALRRASLSVLRILVEKKLALDLRNLLSQALQGHTTLKHESETVNAVLTYMIDRFRAWYEEAGVPAQVFQAVHAKAISEPLDFDRRVKAVHTFSKMSEAESLAAANKRVSNILSKHQGVIPDTINKSLLQEASEKSLAAAIDDLSKKVSPLFADRKYEQGLQTLATIRQQVDDFFDQVMVNVDEPAVRDNRLALLKQLRELFLQVSDISLLAGSA